MTNPVTDTVQQTIFLTLCRAGIPAEQADSLSVTLMGHIGPIIEAADAMHGALLDTRESGLVATPETDRYARAFLALARYNSRHET
jgi:hypothetical protein